jgi:hypothetical protein
MRAMSVEKCKIGYIVKCGDETVVLETIGQEIIINMNDDEARYEQVKEIWKHCLLTRRINPRKEHLCLLTDEQIWINARKDKYGKITGLTISKIPFRFMEEVTDCPANRIFIGATYQPPQEAPESQMGVQNPYPEMQGLESTTYQGTPPIDALNEFKGMRFGGAYGDAYALDFRLSGTTIHEQVTTGVPELNSLLRIRSRVFKVVYIDHLGFIKGREGYAPLPTGVFRQHLAIGLIKKF